MAEKPPFAPSNLVGLREISQRAGMGFREVVSLRQGKGFPRPLVVLSVGEVYWWPEIRKWLSEDRRSEVAEQVS